MDNKREIATKQILGMLRSGTFPAGSKLPTERELAEQLGISRNILRESIIQLEMMGVLEVKKRQGIFVKNHPDSDMMKTLQSFQFWPQDFLPQLTELRLIICVPATQIAALRRTQQDLEKMWECFSKLASCQNRTHEEKLESNRWDSMLHALTVQAAHNELINRVYDSLSVLIEKSNSMLHLPLVLEDGWFGHTVNQQREIISAIEKRNPTNAGEIMKKHIVDTIEAMLKITPREYSEHRPFYWEIPQIKI